MPAAYQDENGKWFKQCTTTKQIFGPVDNKEDLSEWFTKEVRSDGFCYVCIEAKREKSRQYRQKNAQKLNEKNRQYCQQNPQIRQQYRQQNAQKLNEKRKQYRLTPAGFLTHYKSTAKGRGINFTLTLEWFEEQFTKPEFKICAISQIEFVDANGNPTQPFSRSLDRISSTKGYTPDNIRWVCFKYNSWKSDLTLEDIARIFKYTAQSHNLDPVEILNQVS